MNVTLPKELEEFVLKKAATGEYPSADGVVAEGLREFQTKVNDESEPAWTHPLSDRLRAVSSKLTSSTCS